ncbi:MAG: pentapeptide repeat-containing protein [Methylococcaceae bacterium]|nr:pentapeptide repeat-containing protein [Methylococcaceae bacterium]
MQDAFHLLACTHHHSNPRIPMYERFLKRKQRRQTQKERTEQLRKVEEEKIEQHRLAAEAQQEKHRLLQEQKAEAMLQAVNESARHVRNFYITFLMLGLYISVIVWSTTDEMLLRISPVTLPLLNLKLPIKGFYAFAPYLFLLTHFNLLLQLYLLSDKLHCLNKTLKDLPEQSLREHFQSRLFPFPFTQLLAVDHSSRLGRSLLALMVWILILILPPLILLQLQLGFLPFHDQNILFWQRFAVGTDLLLLWLFWPLIRSTDSRLLSWYRQASEIAIILRWIRTRCSKNSGTASSPIRCMGWPYMEAWSLSLLSVVLLVFSWGLATMPGEAKEQQPWADWLPQSWWLLKAENQRTTRIPPIRILEDELKWTVYLFDDYEAPFHRSLKLSEKLLISNQITPAEEQALYSGDENDRKKALKNTKGLNLKGRDLQFANFQDAVLSKADLRDTKLQGANLSEANLQGTNLSEAKLQGAVLYKANLQSANLRWTKLQNADLSRGNLQGAVLRGANLQNANLRSAKLQGAVLREANLQNADLRWTKLQGMDLIGAKLQNAVLSMAELQGVDLRGANLQNAVLSGANLQGADLREANLQDADLSATKLSLTNLMRVTTGPFSQKMYQDLRKSLAQTISDDKLNKLVLKMIEWSLEKNPIVKDAEGKNIRVDDNPESHSRKLLLKSDKLKPAASEQAYLNDLKAFLANLACQDQWIAKRIVLSRTNKQDHSCQETKTIASSLLEQKNNDKDQCPGLAELDDDLLRGLKEVSHTQCD